MSNLTTEETPMDSHETALRIVYKMLDYNSIRRAREVQALPDWVDTSELLNIYLARPKGTHVDHIIPLVNRWVCGLHVPNNLQYLSAEDNRRKSNKFDIEEFNLKYYNS